MWSNKVFQDTFRVLKVIFSIESDSLSFSPTLSGTSTLSHLVFLNIQLLVYVFFWLILIHM